MPIGTSNPEQPYFEDEYAHASAQHEAKMKADASEMAANERSGSFENRFPDRPIVYISPDQEPRAEMSDRRNMGLLNSIMAGETTESIMQKGRDVLKYGPLMSGLERGAAINAETVPPETELSKQLGTSDIRMPPESPTEPAGALKPEGSTQVPGPSAPRLKVGDITPEGETVAHTTASPLVNITHEDIERGINVALSSGAGTIAGVKSKVADTDKLLDAFVMAGQRESPSKIFRKTGWYQGHEGKWKYEIDDSKALFDRQWHKDNIREVLNKSGESTGRHEAKLFDIYDHPDLYKAYPDLKNLKVTSDPNYKGVAEYSSTKDTIRMNPEHAGDQGVLAHEIQHAVQEREGFAKGGSWGEAGKDYELKYTEATKALIPEADALLNKMHEQGLKSEEWDRLKHLGKLFETHGAYKEAGDAEAKQYYMRMAGEIEARNVERRLYMTAKERRAERPMYTEQMDLSTGGTKPIVVNEPAYTSAYGVIHPETGIPMKADKPTEFRRAANENEKPMDLSPLTDALRKHFYETVQKPHEEFIKKYDELHALGEKSSKWTELDRARYNKLGREINPDWEDVK